MKSPFSSFVFLVMVLQELNKTKFKEILAYSTIAMLAFMISIASYGSDATTIVLYLIFFHALTKAILFMCAGILEKKYRFDGEKWKFVTLVFPNDF